MSKRQKGAETGKHTETDRKRQQGAETDIRDRDRQKETERSRN